MKKIKRIGALVLLFVLNFYNICFADVVPINPLTGEPYYNYKSPAEKNKETLLGYIIVGVLILLAVSCAVFLIRKTLKKKKNQLNAENKSDNADE